MAKRSDNYETPQYLADWATNYAISVLGKGLEYQYLLLEPGCGAKAPFAVAGTREGCITRAVELRDVLGSKKAPACDIFEEGFDFLSPDNDWGDSSYDIIVANPPFSIAESFIWKSLELLHPRGVMVYLLRVNFLSSLKRRKLYAERPPQEVHVLQRRPSFSYDGKTDMTEYAFYVWMGEAHNVMMQRYGNPGTILKWLDNKQLEKDCRVPGEEQT